MSGVRPRKSWRQDANCPRAANDGEEDQSRSKVAWPRILRLPTDQARSSEIQQCRKSCSTICPGAGVGVLSEQPSAEFGKCGVEFGQLGLEVDHCLANPGKSSPLAECARPGRCPGLRANFPWSATHARQNEALASIFAEIGRPFRERNSEVTSGTNC